MARLQQPSADRLGALQILLRLYPSLPLRFSWPCLIGHIHGVAAKCQAVPALHKTAVALTVENMNTPEGRASFAFVSLLSKIRGESVAAPKLPSLKVNFNGA